MVGAELEQLRKEVEHVAARTNFSRASLIPILRKVKEQYRGIDSEAMQVIADVLGIHSAEVDAVATFYSFIQPETQGQFIFRLCRTYSCELSGKEEVAAALEKELGVGFGEHHCRRRLQPRVGQLHGHVRPGSGHARQRRRLHPVDAREDHRDRAASTASASRPAARADSLKPEVHADTEQMKARNELTFSKIRPGDGLKKALTMTRADIIDTVRDSKLKGRGGAGFPTGIKWNFAAAERRSPKYVMCNADEGEPGTFKDRLILSQYPDLVIEGMTIAGRAIGAPLGLIYLRAEYGYLRPHLEAVIKRRTEAGLLGDNVVGVQGFNFRIMVAMGAGAYVCGEETALIESLEGFRGEPRNRPPFPVVSGFLNRPSIVNNVETLAWVPCIMSKGIDWFKSIGTENSTGHKLFSVSGDCEKPGVYEFPFGITISELLREVGGDDAKAVQIGGASGRNVPKKDFERKLAFEDIPTGGSIIVIGPDRDMLELAHNLLDFFVDESCGQCTPCRLGNAKLLEGVEMMRAGTCPPGYCDELKSLANTMQTASKCGLGQTSSVAFLSILEHFGEECNGR